MKTNPDSVLEALAHAEHALDNYDLSQARSCLDKAKAAEPENEVTIFFFFTQYTIDSITQIKIQFI